MRSCALIFCFVCAACETGDDPKPVSIFPEEDPAGRSISGKVFQGTEAVPGALLLIDGDSKLANNAVIATSDPSSFPRSVATDPAGGYLFLFDPINFDLSVRRDREAFVFEELSTRFFSPPLGADVPVTGFKARVVPTTTPPPAPGHAIAYFVSGYDSRQIVPRDPGPYEATFRLFDTSIRIHAVEYVTSAGLASAVAYGFVDARVVAASVITPVITTSPLTAKSTVTFAATPPGGFALAPLEVEMDLTLRTSTHPVAHVMPGVPLTITGVPFARYYVHATATHDGATSQSGRFMFDATKDGTIVVPLPEPVSAEAPIDDQAMPGSASATLAPPVLTTNGSLSARIPSGVIEHVLAPVSSTSPTIHIATSSRATTLPDVTRLGLPHPTGHYTWTIEHFALLDHIDQLTGEDGRVTPASWKSAPRVIELR